jgi:hypothetical protein
MGHDGSGVSDADYGTATDSTSRNIGNPSSPGERHTKKPDCLVAIGPFIINPGDDLLSHKVDPCSTMGPGGLNFRVRDGNGCDPSGMIAGKPFVFVPTSCQLPAAGSFGSLRMTQLQRDGAEAGTDAQPLSRLGLNSAASKCSQGVPT